MAELTIRLELDPTTGKRNVTIGYRSEEDALPMEHEDEHRRLVNALVEGGVVAAEELGTITVEREQPAGAVAERGEEPERDAREPEEQSG